MATVEATANPKRKSRLSKSEFYIKMPILKISFGVVQFHMCGVWFSFPLVSIKSQVVIYLVKSSQVPTTLHTNTR